MEYCASCTNSKACIVPCSEVDGLLRGLTSNMALTTHVCQHVTNFSPEDNTVNDAGFQIRSILSIALIRSVCIMSTSFLDPATSHMLSAQIKRATFPLSCDSTHHTISLLFSFRHRVFQRILHLSVPQVFASFRVSLRTYWWTSGLEFLLAARGRELVGVQRRGPDLCGCVVNSVWDCRVFTSGRSSELRRPMCCCCTLWQWPRRLACAEADTC